MSVQELSREHKNGAPEELLKITTTQSDTETPGQMRVPFELKDKYSKTCLGEIKIATPNSKLSLIGPAPTEVDTTSDFYDGEGETPLRNTRTAALRKSGLPVMRILFPSSQK